MATNIALDFMQLLSVSRKCNALFELKRFYARGSRYFPTVDRPSTNNNNEDNNNSLNSSSNSRSNDAVRSTAIPRTFSESPKQMLENAASFRDAVPRNMPKERMEDVWNSDPYPKGSNWKQSQAKYSKRPGCDPRETSIILFPGQGSITILSYCS